MWRCNHTQTTARRCIRCCHPHPKWFVLRRAAGGSPAANRYLCDDCLEVYTALGLVVGPAKDTPSFSKSARSLPLRIRAEVSA